jgi:hypothetical protein
MSKGPKQVLIIRHGEKCGDPKKDDDGNLSVRGSARAAALPSLNFCHGTIQAQPASDRNGHAHGHRFESAPH